MANTNAKKKKKFNSFSIIKIVLCSCLVLLIVGAIAKEASEYSAKKKEKAKKRKVEVFDRLLAAGQRLLSVIRRNEGGANKDLAKFADQINMLCDKWDR